MIRKDTRRLHQVKAKMKSLTVAAFAALSFVSIARTVDSPCYASEAISDPIEGVAAVGPCRIVSLASYVYEPRILTQEESPWCDIKTTPFMGLFLLIR